MMMFLHVPTTGGNHAGHRLSLQNNHRSDYSGRHLYRRSDRISKRRREYKPRYDRCVYARLQWNPKPVSGILAMLRSHEKHKAK
jgi:predicted adenine nucleotide alpha hydrolase (AANH) superfamily ATPase